MKGERETENRFATRILYVTFYRYIKPKLTKNLFRTFQNSGRLNILKANISKTFHKIFCSLNDNRGDIFIFIVD